MSPEEMNMKANIGRRINFSDPVLPKDSPFAVFKVEHPGHLPSYTLVHPETNVEIASMLHRDQVLRTHDRLLVIYNLGKNSKS